MSSLPITNWSKPEQRFWARVNKSGPIHPVYGQCWEWTGPPGHNGYGQFMVMYKSIRAHRYSYSTQVGPIPDGHRVLHKCDNRKCVRPDHLFTGTDQDNHTDKVAKGRQAKGETNGSSKLTDSQIKEIRRRYALRSNKYHDPVNGQGALAREFNVTQATVSLIVRGEVWKHIE